MKFYLLLPILLLLGNPVFSERMVETFRTHSFYRFTFEAFHTNWIDLPDNVSTNSVKNRGVRVSRVVPFKAEGPGFSFATGPSIAWEHYYQDVYEWKFDESGQVAREGIVNDTTDFTNRLSNRYLELPVELQYVTDGKPTDQWAFAVGLRPGWLVSATSEYSTDEYTMTLSTKNNFNRFRLNTYARAGFTSFALHFGTDLTSMFSSDNPEIRTWQAGLTVSFW